MTQKPLTRAFALESEKRSKRAKRNMSASALVMTGGLVGSAFVPMAATANFASPECRFDAQEMADLAVELLYSGEGACEVIELIGQGIPGSDNGGNLFELEEDLVIPYGKSVTLFSNDGAVLVSDNGEVFGDVNPGDEVGPLYSIKHGTVSIPGVEYSYEDRGLLTLDGLLLGSGGNYILDAGEPEVFAIVNSNQDLVIKNSGFISFGTYAPVLGHNILIENTTLLGLSVSGIYSLPAIEETDDALAFVGGQVTLRSNTFLTQTLAGDVTGVGTRVAAEGNIFSNDFPFLGFPDSTPPGEGAHFNVVDIEDFFGDTGPAPVDFSGFWFGDSEGDPPFEGDLSYDALPENWLTESFNLFSLDYPGWSSLPPDDGDDGFEAADVTSRTGVTAVELDFEEIEETEEANLALIFAIGAESIAREFVTNPSSSLPTKDARGFTRSIPYSAGAYEFGASASRPPQSRPSAPILDSSTPSRLRSQSGRDLSLIGQNLSATTEVRIGGKLANLKSTSSRELLVKAPTGLRGFQDVALKTGSGDFTFSGKVFFTTQRFIRGVFGQSEVLTGSMERQIRKFLRKNPHARSISCQGLSSQTLSDSERASARIQGKAVCDFIKQLRPNIEVSRISPIVDKRLGTSIRRTQIKVIG